MPDANAQRKIPSPKQIERERARKLREHTPEILDAMFDAIKKKLKANDPGIIQMTAKMMKYLDVGPAVQVNTQILNAPGAKGTARGGARSFESIIAALDGRAELERPASDVRAIEASPIQEAEFEEIPGASCDKAEATVGAGSGGGRIDSPPGREGGDVGPGEEAR